MSHMLSLPERLRRVAMVSDLMLAGSVHAYDTNHPHRAHQSSIPTDNRVYYRPDPALMHDPLTQRLSA